MVANFRTYESQLRLLTAVVAAHDIKLNYKDIQKHFGDDWSENGIEHFFRPVKKNAVQIRKMIKANPSANAAEFDHNMKGGGGPAAAGGPSGVPKTPRNPAGRKRNGATFSKTPASKKAKSTHKSLSTAVDDDSASDIDVPAPVLTPNVDEKAMAAHEAKMRLNNPPAVAPPSLGSTRGAASITEDDEDLKVITPQDAAPSFVHSSRGSQSAPLPPAVPHHTQANGTRYDPSPFFNSAGYDEHQGQAHHSYVEDDDEDDEFDV